MKNRAFKYILFVAVLLFLVVAFGTTAEESVPEFVTASVVAEALSGKLSETDGIADEAVYIVRLQDALLSSYRGGIGRFTGTSPSAVGDSKLDVNSAASMAYRDYLAASGIAPRAHVAAYKALGPVGGVTSDLVAAIDEAVADGVDVINYSVEAHDVVLCQRGEIARVARGDNILAGGGGGVVLYNPVEQGLATDNFVIPAVHVENHIGEIIKGYVKQYPGEVTISFSQGQKTMDSDPRVTSDMMASFSSRGPNTSVPDIIKPNVTAPGVQNLARASPNHDGAGAHGELFQSIQGTSMSSPHVAGAGALMKAVHPDWSPSEIESALMTTADRSHVKEDGVTEADPFDLGGGRIDMLVAAEAPLVLHETIVNYQAANPALGGDPKTLNIASMGNSKCLVMCAWTRSVRNVTDQTRTWNATVSGITGTVTPAIFTLDPGATQYLKIVINGGGLPEKEWAYGEIELVPEIGRVTDDTLPSTRLPIAVKGNHATINTRRDAGSYLMEDVTVRSSSETTFDPHGFVVGEDSQISLRQNLSNDEPCEDLNIDRPINFYGKE